MIAALQPHARPSTASAFPISIRTPARVAEIGWFSALCNEDYEYLGVADGRLRSSFEHCSEIFQTADRLGYQSILMPSAFEVGQEPLVFGAAMAAVAPSIQQLIAIRMGEIHPPMLARHIATLDHMLKGRLTLNIISSDLPGESLAPEDRYARSREVLQILRQCWTQDRVDFQGKFYQLKIPRTDAAKPYQQNGGPLLYFGGTSSAARDLCAEYCDVFLMWPEPEERLRETMADVSARAAEYGRTIDFGLRIHVIVRETEEEARAHADKLLSRLDERTGEAILARSHDTRSEGMRRQVDLRRQSVDDYIEENVWCGIGRARSGCGSAIVGNPEQVLNKINRYLDMGIRAFILSGYPHIEESELFAKHILPRLKTCRMPVLQGRRPEGTPVTPLTTGPRP